MGDVTYVAGSERRSKSEVGRTGARFGHVPASRGRAEEEKWGEPAVPTAKPGTGRTGARFGVPGPQPPPPRVPPPAQIPQQATQWPEPGWTEVDRTRSIVRPYAWTGGRTETAYDLPLEALISTNRATLARNGPQMTHDHRSVAELCLSARSVAEVAALLSLPLGVARVVLGDMASAGMVVVHRAKSSAGEEPDLAMMERVLTGLRNL
ncbi:DUF742 domain-containing protein [Kibdelosporangium persicum]|uniref:DUF742 domain-containing protein n=1 Tax=Kibdelosporangium persicum TaxID=2698649 RepID=UPI0015678302|nr:DUF742 domain-containing protein [Kibdelosporangium persicum]